MELARGKILIIQSDPVARDLMTLSLTRAGYDVQVSDDLRQALPLLRDEAPHLILLDLFLKDSVGLDSLYYVRKEIQAAETQVMIVSALCFKEIVQVAAKAGACDFLAKPVDPVDLLQRVQKAMARAQELTDSAPLS
jgi:DNA-binding response OmpR family regulator